MIEGAKGDQATLAKIEKLMTFFIRVCLLYASEEKLSRLLSTDNAHMKTKHLK